MMDSDERDGSEAVLSLPAAHPQLLSHDPPAFVDLKGYDHTLERSRELDVGYDIDETDVDETLLYPALGFAGHDDTFAFASSWLLGFARKRADGDTVATSTPGLVRVPSSKRMSESGDESVSSKCPGLVHVPSSDRMSESSSESVSSTPSASHTTKTAKKCVSFSSSVKVQPIPHYSSLSPAQQQAMYTSTLETRRNRIRNKKEWRYDDCDWLTVAEEQDMEVCEATGELIHPAHEFD